MSRSARAVNGFFEQAATDWDTVSLVYHDERVRVVDLYAGMHEKENWLIRVGGPCGSPATRSSRGRGGL